MKRTVLFLSVLLLVGSTANAQNILQRLGEKAKEAAEQNIGNKVEKGVNDVLDGKVGKKDKKKAKNGKTEVAEEAGTAVAGWTCAECGKAGNTGKFCEDCGAKKPGAETAAKPALATARWIRMPSALSKRTPRMNIPGVPLTIAETLSWDSSIRTLTNTVRNMTLSSSRERRKTGQSVPARADMTGGCAFRSNTISGPTWA